MKNEKPIDPPDIQIIQASYSEWGLTINGKGVRTWWKSEFPDGKPNPDHPKIQEAVNIWMSMEE